LKEGCSAKGDAFKYKKEKNIGVLYESVINIGLSCFGLFSKV
jgi:hypothetical protein